MIKILACLGFLLSTQILSAQQTTALPQDSAVFKKVDKEAEFEEGISGWRKYLEKNLNASTPIDNGAPAGTYTVVVQFIVDKDGSLFDFKPLTNFGYGLEKEVLRILKLSPKWTPAILEGQPVKAYRKQPVTFIVMEAGRKRKRKH